MHEANKLEDANVFLHSFLKGKKRGTFSKIQIIRQKVTNYAYLA